MEIIQDILTELGEIAPGMRKIGRLGTPYAIPEGFFEDFAKVLLNRINFEESPLAEPDPLIETAEISPLLAGLRKINPYRVPDGYFANTTTKIPAFDINKPKLAQIETGSPALDSTYIGNEDIRGNKTGRISTLSRITKYAGAASLVSLLGITIFNVTNRNLPDPLHGLTTVSDQDMANYLDADDIHWTPGPAPEAASNEYSDNDIHTLFSNISDVELEQYHPELPFEKGKAN
jgi:hypothetical protein